MTLRSFPVLPGDGERQLDRKRRGMPHPRQAEGVLARAATHGVAA